MTRRTAWRWASETVLVLFGAYLVLDALVLHMLMFDYGKIGLAGLDPYVSHAYWGIGLAAIGAADWHRSR